MGGIDLGILEPHVNPSDFGFKFSNQNLKIMMIQLYQDILLQMVCVIVGIAYT